MDGVTKLVQNILHNMEHNYRRPYASSSRVRVQHAEPPKRPEDNEIFRNKPQIKNISRYFSLMLPTIFYHENFLSSNFNILLLCFWVLGYTTPLNKATRTTSSPITTCHVSFSLSLFFSLSYSPNVL